MKYKEWDIEYNPKPIPDRRFDYDAVHPDYDGADGGNGLAFNAGSIEEAQKKIDEITCVYCSNPIQEAHPICESCQKTKDANFRFLPLQSVTHPTQGRNCKEDDRSS